MGGIACTFREDRSSIVSEHRKNCEKPGISRAVESNAKFFSLSPIVNGEGSRHGVPIPMLFIFGAVGLLASMSDVRMIRSGGIRGARRLARHLRRMCFALFIASGSFFLGQADKFPESLRIIPLLIVLTLAPLVVLLYWLWRVRVKKTLRGIVGVNSPEAI